MLKDQLSKMLAKQEPAIKEVIKKVLVLEQENISFKQPRLKNDIDEIIDKAAKRVPNKKGKVN